MLFSSFSYIFLFLPSVVIVSMLARRVSGPRGAQVCVLLASLLFYAWWKPTNLPYLAVSIVVNWLLAHAMSGMEQPRRKHLLVTGLVLNVGYLCIFKYINFLLGSFSFLAPGRFHLPDFEFPLGISFFTLSQIMYLVDCYEELLPALSLFDHATFVSFFPYVISGPIARAKRMAHQFGHLAARWARGLRWFLAGSFYLRLGCSRR